MTFSLSLLFSTSDWQCRSEAGGLYQNLLQPKLQPVLADYVFFTLQSGPTAAMGPPFPKIEYNIQYV